jgi:hypothetical protein
MMQSMNCASLRCCVFRRKFIYDKFYVIINFSSKRLILLNASSHIKRTIIVNLVEVHMAELLVSRPSRLEVKTTVAKLKKYKSPGSD